MARSTSVACACLLIAQLNYAKCGPEYRLKPTSTRQAAELRPDEVQRGCAISSVWRELHLVEIRCPEPSAQVQRSCIDGATIGSYRKKDNLLVNCLFEPAKK
jgi:hypothetical protein